MKTKILLLSLISFITVNVFAQNWTWQYPYPNSNEIITSYFFNENTGYFGGEMGNLLKTTNGGANITVQNAGNNYNINSIFFINPTTGYIAAGYNEKIIMRTTNGGSNWLITNFGTPFSVRDIKFANANSGIAVSSYQDIYYTTNGGNNWITINGAASSLLYSVEYVTANTAYVSGYGGIILKTTNGGVNWTSQSVASGTTSLYDIQFLDSLTGYICGNNSIVLKTTNGGLNWTNVNAPGTYTIYSLSFINSSTGVAVCDNGKFLKTTNGGLNWTVQTPYPANGNKLNTVKYFPSGVIYASGIFGSNMKSTDSGDTWTSLVQGLNTYIFDSYFLNANTGFASMNFGYILKTTNGGTNWIESYTPAGASNITSIMFINSNTGFAVPAYTNNILLKTTNAGENWFSLNTGINTYANGIYFSNSTTGVLISDYKTYSTTNGGNNWNFIDSVNYTLYNLEFINSSTGYVSAYSSSNTFFRKTTNGGLNWSMLPGSISNASIQAYKFFNENTGYAAGVNNMYKTTDGGNNWNITSNISMLTQTMHLFDSNTILIGGVYGELKKSTDGGISFSDIPFVSHNIITTMSFINKMTGWVMGQGGMIVKTNDILTNKKEIKTEIPAGYELSQNFPNPFNPSTKINFAIPKQGMVTLKVYDILGREVANLVNEVKTAGNYIVDFDASTLSSGVYFYKLEVNGFSDVKRMMLIK